MAGHDVHVSRRVLGRVEAVGREVLHQEGHVYRVRDPVVEADREVLDHEGHADRVRGHGMEAARAVPGHEVHGSHVCHARGLGEVAGRGVRVCRDEA